MKSKKIAKKSPVTKKKNSVSKTETKETVKRKNENESFSEIKDLFKQYEGVGKLYSIEKEQSTGYELYCDEKQILIRGKPVMFGGVYIRKGGIAVHLMPLYCNPKIRSNLPPMLEKCMTGKSCMTIKKYDSKLHKKVLKDTIKDCYSYYVSTYGMKK